MRRCKLRQIARKEDRRFGSCVYVQPLPFLPLVVRNVLMLFEEVWQADEAGDSCASDVTASLSLSLSLTCLLLVTLQPRMLQRNYCVIGKNNSTSKEEKTRIPVPKLFPQPVGAEEAAV